MNADGASRAALPNHILSRIHALWDEVADFGAEETDAALVHALRVLSELVDAQNAFWLGAVRLGTGGDALGGWRMRAMRRLNPTPADDHVYGLSRQSLDHGTADDVTLAQVREAGMFRARLLHQLASPEFFATPAYDVLYRARNIRDAIFVACPVNEDAESYFGCYRIGAARNPSPPTIATSSPTRSAPSNGFIAASCWITACSSRAGRSRPWSVRS
jgi:hypothetical protein